MNVRPLFTLNDVPPALRGCISPAADLTFPPQGMTSEVAFADGDTRCVVKRCRNPIYLSWISREHQVLRALADTAVPAPRAHGYAEVETGNGREAWLVMSRLEGRPLWADMLAATPQRRAHLLRRLGASLKQLHMTPVPADLRFDSSCIDRMLAQARENLPWCDGTPELLEVLQRCLPAPVPEVLIHGDLALDNVLVTAEDGVNFIDWSGGGEGDPRLDIALALRTKPEFELGEHELAAFYEGYGSAPVDQATLDWFVGLYDFF